MPVESEPRRRGRPRGSEGSDLLDAARAEFLESGFDGTTMAMVAARARVSKASLYREYPSKDALFAAVVGDWVARGHDAMRPHVEALVHRGCTPEALLHFARLLQSAVLDQTVLAMRDLVTSQSRRQRKVAQEYLTEGWNRNIAILGDGFAELQHGDALAAGDARVMAEQFTWLTVAEPLNAHALGAALSKERLAHVAEEAVATFLARHGPG